VDTSVILDDMYRRRAESRRLEPLTCGCHQPHVDPFDCQARQPTEPSCFGLTATELVAEIKRRDAEGWSHWELLARFSNPLDRQAA
jgi:hypothetical protein